MIVSLVSIIPHFGVYRFSRLPASEVEDIWLTRNCKKKSQKHPPHPKIRQTAFDNVSNPVAKSDRGVGVVKGCGGSTSPRHGNAIAGERVSLRANISDHLLQLVIILQFVHSNHDLHRPR